MCQTLHDWELMGQEPWKSIYLDSLFCPAYGLSVCVFLPMCSLWASFSSSWLVICFTCVSLIYPCFMLYLKCSLPLVSLSGLESLCCATVVSSQPCITLGLFIEDFCSYLSCVSTFLAPLHRQSRQKTRPKQKVQLRAPTLFCFCVLFSVLFSVFPYWSPRCFVHLPSS